jgi:hypothetical protein
MLTFLLIIYHVLLVTAVYWTAYRTGYKACRAESQRLAQAYATPLTQMLEKLNLNTEEFLNDKRNDDSG